MLTAIWRVSDYTMKECGLSINNDHVGWLIQSHRALANEHRPVDNAALDALILFADEMETQIENHFDGGIASIGTYHDLMDQVDKARDRAAELAGRLYESV